MGKKHKESQEHDLKISSKNHHATKVIITVEVTEYSTSVNRPFHFQFHDIKLSGSEYISLNNLHSSWKPKQDPSVDYDIIRWF